MEARLKAQVLEWGSGCKRNKNGSCRLAVLSGSSFCAGPFAGPSALTSAQKRSSLVGGVRPSPARKAFGFCWKESAPLVITSASIRRRLRTLNRARLCAEPPVRSLGLRVCRARNAELPVLRSARKSSTIKTKPTPPKNLKAKGVSYHCWCSWYLDMLASWLQRTTTFSHAAPQHHTSTGPTTLSRNPKFPTPETA